MKKSKRVMRILLILILFNIITLISNAQCTGGSFYYDEPSQNIFLGPMSKPINPSLPTSHPLLGSNWVLNSLFSDEFNGPALDPKWMMNYGDTNSNPNFLNCNRSDGNNHSFYTTGGNSYLKMEMKKETYSDKVVRWKSNTEILSDGKPNYRGFEYTTGMIKSYDPVNQPYGFFEIRCKIPKGRNLIADFWLYNASDASGNSSIYPTEAFYDEIDIFEIDNGTLCHLTTHTRVGSCNPVYDRHKELNAIDNRAFSDDFNTYSIKWEPNKLTYYINNQLVRVVTDNIASHRLHIIANIEMVAGNTHQGRGILSDDIYPTSYDIDYIRVYNRNNISYSDPVFTLNNNKTSTPSSPVSAKAGKPIILNGIEAFSPTNIYFVAIQRCNSLGILMGTEMAGWLTATEISNIRNLNLLSFCSSRGHILIPGYTYQVKL